jgi:hypothetical protein
MVLSIDYPIIALYMMNIIADLVHTWSGTTNRDLRCLFVYLMVFKATFNNISVISWRSVLLMEDTEGPGENHRPVASH